MSPSPANVDYAHPAAQKQQTCGADMKWNPHVHCIVTEGGFDRQWNWINTYYLPYKFWRRK
jgi:hypothetical protein